MAKPLWLTISILFLISTRISGQEYQCRHYTAAEGLPQAELYHVFQDHKGFIWVAGDKGVSRFNGEEFEVFDVNDGLPDNTIFEIYPDSAGRLWFVSYSSLLSYFQNGKIEPYQHNEKLRKAVDFSREILKKQFTVGSDGSITASFRWRGMMHISPQGKINKNTSAQRVSAPMHVFLDSPERIFTRVHSPLFNDTLVLHNGEHKDTLWLGTGLQRQTNVFAIWQDQRTFLLSINGNLFKIRDRKIVQKVSFPSAIIWLSIEQDNNLWVGTAANGAFMFNHADLTSQPKNYLHGKAVSSVLQDRIKKGYWFTTLKQGLFYLPAKEFKYLLYEENKRGEKLEDGLNKIALRNHNEFFVGKGKNTILYIKNGKIKKQANFSLTNTATQEIKNLFYDHQNQRLLLFATAKMLTMKNGKISPFFFEEADMKVIGNNFRTWHADSSGNQWFGNSAGIYKTRNDFLLYSSRFSTDSFTYKTNDICQSPDGRLWLASQKGLWVYDGKHYKKIENKYSQERFLAVTYNFADQAIWASVKNKGILVFKNATTRYITPAEGLISNIIEGFAQTGNYLWAYSSKGVSRLRATNFEKKHFEVYNLTENEGLPHNKVTSLQALGDTLYVVTPKALCYFSYKDFKPSTAPPLIYITKFSVNQNDTTLRWFYDLNHNQSDIALKFLALGKEKSKKIEYQGMLYPADKTFKRQTNNLVAYKKLQPGNYCFMVKARYPGGRWSMPMMLFFAIRTPFWQQWWFYVSIAFVLLGAFWGLIAHRARVKQKRLREQNIKLERMVKQRTAEIVQQKEEIAAQRDLAQSQHDQIDRQNKELEKHRQHLEKMVRERTRDLQAAKEKAEESDRLKTSFLANISHEIRTPMNAIIGFTAMLESSRVKLDKRQKLIQQINRASDKLLSLLDSIIDLSRLETKQLDLKISRIEINKMLFELWGHYNRQKQNLNKDTITIRLRRATSSDIFIQNDPMALKQVLGILVENALKFTKQGVVELGYSLDSKHFVKFYVKDTGIGIDPEKREEIFKPFVKKHPPQAEKFYEGTGLGLAICEKLVFLMNGNLTMISQVNKGTTFYVSIPYKITEKKITQQPNEYNQLQLAR